jgi:2-dehydropantoate 2-reductase
MSPPKHSRVLIMGCGGIGGIVAGHLAEIGADVTAVTTNGDIAAAVRERGFRLRGDGNPRDVRGRIEVGIPSGEPPFDYVILATQPPQVEQAARTALPFLAPDGAVVCFQNGLCELRVADLIGAERTLGGVVAWGGSMPEPGLYDRTAQGGFTLGRLAGPIDDQVLEIGRLLEAVGPVNYTANLQGVRWSKLAINCAISSMGTMAGEHLGPLVRVRRYRRLCLEVMSEAVAVAQAEGVALEKVAGTIDLEWIALTEAERSARAGSPSLAAKHGLLMAVGMRYRRLRSSMLSAIERGRVPAIDFLNGEVVSRSQAHQIPVPVNAAIVRAVHDIARGHLQPHRDLLDTLYKKTRS